MTPDKYVRRGLHTLSAELAARAHPASPTTVANLLRDLEYNLPARRTRTGIGSSTTARR